MAEERDLRLAGIVDETAETFAFLAEINEHSLGHPIRAKRQREKSRQLRKIASILQTTGIPSTDTEF
jgi:hypothetical protein